MLLSFEAISLSKLVHADRVNWKCVMIQYNSYIFAKPVQVEISPIDVVKQGFNESAL